MRLTDLSIKALKAPENGAIIYADDTLTGLGVRVSQAGTKSFVLTHGARRQRETIGRVGIISLAEARQEAKRRLSEYTLGKHKPRSIQWSAALDGVLRPCSLSYPQRPALKHLVLIILCTRTIKRRCPHVH